MWTVYLGQIKKGVLLEVDYMPRVGDTFKDWIDGSIRTVDKVNKKAFNIWAH